MIGRMARVAAVAVVALAAAGSAAGQEAPPAEAPPADAFEVRVSQTRAASGNTIVSMRLRGRTYADPPTVTVMRRPGAVACPTELQDELWPADTRQVIFYILPRERRTAASSWTPVVRSVEERAGRWTLCAYVIDEGAPRFDLPYVIASARTEFTVARPAPARARAAVRWRACPVGGVRGMVRVQATGGGTTLNHNCRRARAAAAAWGAEFRANAGGPRNNWAGGWFGRGTGIRDYPATRMVQVNVARPAASLACRERVHNIRVLSGPLTVTCGGLRFTYNPR